MSALVQRDEVTFGGSGTIQPVTFPTPVDASRTLVLLTSSRHTGAGRAIPERQNLANKDFGASVGNITSTGFTLTRTTGAESAPHVYRWESWTDTTPAAIRPAHGFYVRTIDQLRMIAGIDNILGISVPGVVDRDQLVVLPLSVRASATSQLWADAMWRLDMSGSQVSADRGQSVDGTTLIYAAVEFGSAWTVRSLPHTFSAAGVEEAINGCGPDPWTRKAFFVTMQVPNGANDMASCGFVARHDPSNPDRLLVSLHPDAQFVGTGDYRMSVSVVSHPQLAVWHRDSPSGKLAPISGQSTTVPLGALGIDAKASGSWVTTTCPGTNAYPLHAWGHSLEPPYLPMRRGRGQLGGSMCALSVQAITFPDGSPGGRYPMRGAIPETEAKGWLPEGNRVGLVAGGSP